jgi:RNA polymerase sigma-70 factor (TIGR02943 family)
MNSPEAVSPPQDLHPAQWLDQHGDHLFAFALAHVGRRDVAEDLVQDTLLSAIVHVNGFQGRSTVRTWLIAILKRKIADHRRKLQHREKVLGEGAASDNGLERLIECQFSRWGKWKIAPKRWSVPDESATSTERDEFRAVLEQCLAKLPSRAAEALTLVEAQGMSLIDLSQMLEITANHLGVILHRARLAVRRCVEIHWLGQPARSEDPKEKTTP